ncbi:ribose transport system permease protein [Natronobacillus azotifigens]|uniref:Autoinducer 2 import system permease protein LsrD n=1 Tax=Natronobacillus azotifigens TaxID=472978 RepID=A0A9J6RB94_9BACI|nr:ABC transporter permease [Natronobacillus azotifigens]MCZ0702505.1 ABC transporter permease [Natronobacillus azotifigens]
MKNETAIKNKNGDSLYKLLNFLKMNKNIIIQYSSLLLVVVIFTVLSDGKLLSSINIQTIIRQLVVIFTISVGLVFVFSHGNMDISVGAVVALSSMVAAFSLNAGAPVWFSTMIAMSVSVACYLLNIYVANQFGLMAVISSLAIMFIARGIVTYIVSTTNMSIRVTEIAVLNLYNNLTFMILSIIIVGIIGVVLFNYKKIGKQNKAIGDNMLSATQSGVNVKKSKVISYIIAGLLVGYGSMFSLARSLTVSENSGMGLEMDVIVALVLGGMALSGGSKSKISSAIVGSITLVLLNNGLTMIGVPAEVVSLVRGIIFLLVIFLILRRPRSEKVVPR